MQGRSNFQKEIGDLILPWISCNRARFSPHLASPDSVSDICCDTSDNVTLFTSVMSYVFKTISVIHVKW